MPPGEFELIERHFARCGAARGDVPLGIGDDAALLAPPAGTTLVQALDTIVSGVHFPAGTGARFVGHRALAVNLSDFAAMGAEPAWALLGLTLPEADETWVADFCAGLSALAQAHRVALVGGDTTRGPLTATVALTGWLPAGEGLRRSGARDGDDLWISGWPGEAGAGLAILQGRLEAAGASRERLLARFLLPEPRVALGQALRGVASACIDVSDGLAGDLARLCAASGVAAELDAGALPLSAALRTACGAGEGRRLALEAGDDYELLFSAPAAARARVEALSGDIPLSRIGRVVAGDGLRVHGAPGGREPGHGFDHFA